MMKRLLPVLLPFLFGGCLDLTDGAKAVEGFELERYLGKWYEIARLDHPFERGLQQVTAEYAMRDDGGVSVTNRGFSTKKGKWEDAHGKAYFVGSSDVGHLKVSFFGPFYGSYGVFELGDEYEYAFVASSSTKYLWFLSRTPQVSPELKARFIQEAKQLGYDTDALIFVEYG